MAGLGKSRAFRGWVAGATAKARAFNGWTIIPAGTQAEFEGLIEAVASAAGALSVRHSLSGLVGVRSDTLASIIVKVRFPTGDVAVSTAAEAVLWLNRVFEGSSLAAVEVRGDFGYYRRILITELQGEKDIAVYDAQLTGDEQMTSTISVVGSVESVAEMISAILAERQDDEGMNATVEIMGEKIPALKRKPTSSQGSDVTTTKIDARR